MGSSIAEQYRLDSLIDRGSHGDVYGGRDASGRPVAVKVLRSELGQHAEHVARLTREAKAIGMLAHPNIVTFLATGVLPDGRPYLVTELLSGATLRELIGRERIAPLRALAIARKVLEALDHAHRHGVIHRDIKPENIVVGLNDVVKVLDFGVAMLADDTRELLAETKLTQPGHSVFGSPAYIAPEIVLGHHVDARTDLYSLGTVLFEMLAERTPFQDEDPVKLLRHHAFTRVPTLAEVGVDSATPELELLVAEALAKEPARRVASAAAMIANVDAARAALKPPAVFAATDPAPSTNTDAPVANGANVAEPARQVSTMVAPAAPPMVSSPAVASTRPAPPPIASSRPAAPTPHAQPIAAPPPAQPRAPAPYTPLVARPAAARPSLPTFARWPWMTRRRIQVTGAAIAACLFIGIAAAVSGGAPSDAAPASAKAIENPHDGEPAAATYTNDAAPKASPVELAHAEIARGRHLAALATYEQVITRDADLARDAQIRKNVITVADGRNAVAAVVALELLGRLDPPARAEIATRASIGRIADVRHRARAIAERDGFANDVDLLASYQLDLKDATTCDDRRAAVDGLRTLADRRAIGALRRAKDRFPCIADDATDAIAALEAHP
ncbi:MAG: protein kinase domain-containing protein [Kofleriaceae bacterium]